jgi:hypothetical protein
MWKQVVLAFQNVLFAVFKYNKRPMGLIGHLSIMQQLSNDLI